MAFVRSPIKEIRDEIGRSESRIQQSLSALETKVDIIKDDTEAIKHAQNTMVGVLQSQVPSELKPVVDRIEIPFSRRSA